MLKWAEGFENYGSSGRPTAVGYKWTTMQNGIHNEIVPGRFHGYGWRMGATWNPTHDYLLSGNIMDSQVWYVGFAFRKRSTSQQGSGSGLFFALRDTSNYQISLYFQTSAEYNIQLYRGLGTTLLTSAYAFNDTAWHYIEVGARIADSGGWVQVRIDGTQIINYSGDTDALSTGTAKQLLLHAPFAYSAWSCEIDDVYVCDDQGSTNNTYLGDITVEALTPTSDGGETGWVPSTGSDKYALVDEVPANTTDYLTGASLDEKVTFGMTDLSYITTGIKGVVVDMTTRNMGISNNELRSLARVGGTTYTPSSTGPSSLVSVADYRTHAQGFDVNPATSAAWTPSEVNAAEFGLKIHA